jgi:alpha-ketoglutarate-dependent taurine dioxygenase|tara:strand:+ start:5852 stop:6736 length:885 start_codon:yes stop_codon:yes gene_type:complete
MKVTNLKFGYEVKDVDYSSKKDAKEIVQLIGDGRFVIVKNPKFVEPETISELYNNMGIVGYQNDEVESAGVGKANGNKEFVRVRTDAMFAGDPENGHELTWHNAGANKHTSDQIVAMYIVAPSEEGGLTGFTDAQTAFSDLPEDKQELLEMYTIEHPIWDMMDESHPYYRMTFKNMKEQSAFLDADGGRSHERQMQFRPLVTEHPVNGKSGFQCVMTLIYKIVELNSVEKSKEFIAWLEEYLLQDKYVYWHDWDIYDIAISDQIHSLHKRTSYKGYRELFRTAINYDDGKDFWY